MLVVTRPADHWERERERERQQHYGGSWDLCQVLWSVRPDSGHTDPWPGPCWPSPPSLLPVNTRHSPGRRWALPGKSFRWKWAARNCLERFLGKISAMNGILGDSLSGQWTLDAGGTRGGKSRQATNVWSRKSNQTVNNLRRISSLSESFVCPCKDWWYWSIDRLWSLSSICIPSLLKSVFLCWIMS